MFTLEISLHQTWKVETKYPERAKPPKRPTRTAEAAETSETKQNQILELRET